MKMKKLIAGLVAASLLLSTQLLRAQTGNDFIDEPEVTCEAQHVAPAPKPQSRAEQRVTAVMQKAYAQTTRLKEGATAADFTAEKYSGGKVTLSSLRGKVVLLTFWATWCGPCLRELAPEALPEVILKQFSGNAGFAFLPVAYTDSKESLDKFFADTKHQTYDYLRDVTLTDPDKAIFGLYATQNVPRSVVIDRNGKILLGSVGAFPGELERIAEAIAAALAR